MKNWKKALAVCLTLAMVFSIAACGGKATPSDQVKKDLEKVKTEEVDENMDSILSDESMKEKYSEDLSSFMKKMQDFDYEIKEEKVNKKETKATVQVHITTYDFGAAYKNTYDTMIQDITEGKVTADTDMESYVYDLMFKNLNGVKDKTYEKDVTINCTKNKDGDWETDINDNSEVQDAIFGGMMTAISGLNQ